MSNVYGTGDGQIGKIKQELSKMVQDATAKGLPLVPGKVGEVITNIVENKQPAKPVAKASKPSEKTVAPGAPAGAELGEDRASISSAAQGTKQS